MCRTLVETIRISEAALAGTSFHNYRLNNSCRILYGKSPDVNIDSLITVPEEFTTGIVKCRLLYWYEEEKFKYRLEFSHYRPRVINSLQLVEGCPDYSLKYADRSALTALEALKGECDGVLIVKSGELTDTSFSNITFLKKGRWFTPVHPLLKGTARAALIKSGLLTEEIITPADISSYEGYRLVNAMLPFDEQPVLPTETIKY